MNIVELFKWEIRLYNMYSKPMNPKAALKKWEKLKEVYFWIRHIGIVWPHLLRMLCYLN
jgi:hypothetical protein